MLEENQNIIDYSQGRKTQAPITINGETLEPVEKKTTEEEMKELMMWFLWQFILVTTIGGIVGALIVVSVMKYTQNRTQKRLNDLQINPAFRFQETTDPSASHGGIPSSNPIGDDDLQSSPDKVRDTEDIAHTEVDVDNIQTERGFTTDRQFKAEDFKD